MTRPTRADRPSRAPSRPPPASRRRRRRLLDGVPATATPSCVTVLAFVVRAGHRRVLIVVADQPTRDRARLLLRSARATRSPPPGRAISDAYSALFEGAIFDPATFAGGGTDRIFDPISRDPDQRGAADPRRPRRSALAFRAGLFNIGGQGQIILGAICAGYVGFAWHLPVVLHLLVALLAGIVGGAIWGGIAGLLKARTGAHEVITTIMLNYVALYLLATCSRVQGFQARPYDQAISKPGRRQRALPAPARRPSCAVNVGLIVALAAAVGVLVAARPAPRSASSCARSAPTRRRPHRRHERRPQLRHASWCIAGALAGLAGAAQVARHQARSITGDVDASIGFDAHHRRAARPGQALGHGARRAAVRRAAGRRRADAGRAPASPIELVDGPRRR